MKVYILIIIFQLTILQSLNMKNSIFDKILKKDYNNNTMRLIMSQVLSHK